MKQTHYTLAAVLAVGLNSIGHSQSFFDGDFTSNNLGANTVNITATTDFNTWHNGHDGAYDLIGGELVRDEVDRSGGTALGGIFDFSVASTGDYTFSFDYTADDGSSANSLTAFIDVVAFDPAGGIVDLDSTERFGFRTATGGTTFNDPFEATSGPITGPHYTVTRVLGITNLGDPGFALGTNQTFSAVVTLNAGTEFVGFRFASDPANNGSDTFTIDNVSLTAIPEPSAASFVGLVLFGGLLLRRRK